MLSLYLDISQRFYYGDLFALVGHSLDFSNTLSYGVLNIFEDILFMAKTVTIFTPIINK